VKISDRTTIAPLPQVTTVSSKRSARVESDRPAGVPDRVSFSDEVQRMLKEDAERVPAIRRQIAEGTYRVDLNQLAEAIVRKEGL